MNPKFATPDHPILDTLSQRYSPYAYDAERAVSDADLRSLFEAARWAASSYNEQPWRFIVATRDDGPEYDKALSCLVEPNQAWAKAAPVLAFGLTSQTFSRNGKPNGCAEHDLGLALGNLSAEATARGLCVHAMAGIHHDRVREQFSVPEGIKPLTALAIGYAADPDGAGDAGAPDRKPRTRKPLSEWIFAGLYGTPASRLG